VVGPDSPAAHRPAPGSRTSSASASRSACSEPSGGGEHDQRCGGRDRPARRRNALGEEFERQGRGDHRQAEAAPQASAPPALAAAHRQDPVGTHQPERQVGHRALVAVAELDLDFGFPVGWLALQTETVEGERHARTIGAGEFDLVPIRQQVKRGWSGCTPAIRRARSIGRTSPFGNSLRLPGSSAFTSRRVAPRRRDRGRARA
jgi:hypothetical protein